MPNLFGFKFITLISAAKVQATANRQDYHNAFYKNSKGKQGLS